MANSKIEIGPLRRGQINAQENKALDATVSGLVNDFSRVQLDRDRAWVLPMGFENGQDAVPPIARQLGLIG